MARHSGRRHVAAARRPDAHRPRLPPDRPRRRHLADADAGPRADPRGARGNVGRQHGARRTGSTSIRSVWTPDHLAVIRAAARGPAGAAHLRQCGDQEGALPRRQPATAPGCTRCAPITGTTIIFTSGSFARRGESACREQDPVPPGDGCDASLDWWFSDAVLHPTPGPERPKPQITLAQLPPECRVVLNAK